MSSSSSPSPADDADASARPPLPASHSITFLPHSDSASLPIPLTLLAPPGPVKFEASAEGVEPTALFSSLFPSSGALSPEALQALLSSLQTSLPFPSIVPLPNPIPLQFLPPGTVLVPLCSLPGPSPLIRRQSVPHPKLLTFSPSTIVHMDVPSSVGVPAIEAAMELNSPVSPASDTSSTSTSSHSDSDEERRGRGGKAATTAPGKRGRPSPYSETESDDSSDSHSSDGSDMAMEAKKRRCVVSAQKLPTDTSHLELTMSISHFQHHSIRIIHTHDRGTGQRATYVHGADVGGVIERKSNISRMFGQFESPREKVLMNVTGKHNHTVGQEANVLTVEGVKRLMGLKKCQPNVDYQHWLRDVLVPRLQDGQEAHHAVEALSSRRLSEGWASVKVEGKVGTVSEGDHSPLHIMAAVCV